MDQALEALRKDCGQEWPALVAARKLTETQCRSIRDEMVASIGSFPADVDLVVCGSLARGEYTEGSDIDWTLLVDGAVNSSHLDIARNIEGFLKAKGYKEPGPTGTFGNLAFSHDLIHLIGGDTDSNANTTRRILLLVESCSLAHGVVRERVIRAILSRYLEEDTHFKLKPGNKGAIPRFLINDVVRYWRTVAVDYANKVRSRGGQGWVLRNLKLRLSRKLIFVSGLLMCLECELDPELPDRPPSKPESEGSKDKSFPYIQKLSQSTNRKPLEILACAVQRHAQQHKKSALAEKLFGSYDYFLSKLGDPEVRKNLSKLDYQQAQSDSEFNALRDAGQTFQEGLIDLFFKSDDRLTELTQEYAVF